MIQNIDDFLVKILLEEPIVMPGADVLLDADSLNIVFAFAIAGLGVTGLFSFFL